MTTLFNCVANRPLPPVLPCFRMGSGYIIGHRCFSLRWSLRASGLLIPTLLASSLGCFFRGMLSIVSAPSFLEGLGHGCPRRAFHEFTKFFDGWSPIRATTMFIEVLDPDVAGGAVDLDASGGAVDDLDVGTAFAADDGRGELRGQRGPSEGVFAAVSHAREHIDDGRGGVSLAFRGHGAEGERAVEHGPLLYSAFVGASNDSCVNLLPKAGHPFAGCSWFPMRTDYIITLFLGVPCFGDGILPYSAFGADSRWGWAV